MASRSPTPTPSELGLFPSPPPDTCFDLDDELTQIEGAHIVAKTNVSSSPEKLGPANNVAHPEDELEMNVIPAEEVVAASTSFSQTVIGPFASTATGSSSMPCTGSSLYPAKRQRGPSSPMEPTGLIIISPPSSPSGSPSKKARTNLTTSLMNSPSTETQESRPVSPFPRSPRSAAASPSSSPSLATEAGPSSAAPASTLLSAILDSRPDWLGLRDAEHDADFIDAEGYDLRYMEPAKHSREHSPEWVGAEQTTDCQVRCTPPRKRTPPPGSDLTYEEKMALARETLGTEEGYRKYLGKLRPRALENRAKRKRIRKEMTEASLAREAREGVKRYWWGTRSASAQPKASSSRVDPEASRCMPPETMSRAESEASSQENCDTWTATERDGDTEHAEQDAASESGESEVWSVATFESTIEVPLPPAPPLPAGATRKQAAPARPMARRPGMPQVRDSMHPIEMLSAARQRELNARLNKEEAAAETNHKVCPRAASPVSPSMGLFRPKKFTIVLGDGDPTVAYTVCPELFQHITELLVEATATPAPPHLPPAAA